MFCAQELKPRICAAIAMGALCLTFAGCGLSTSGLDTKTGSSGVGASISGSIHGGQQPVSGAYIQLYAAGTAFGSGATPLIPTSTTGTPDGSAQSIAFTDTNGNFNITNLYTCPSPTSQVYITAVGGNPGISGQTVNATSIALMASLGNCGNLNSGTTINVNEVTTVAAIWALQNFINIPFSANSSSLWSGGGTCSATGAGTATSPYSCVSAGASTSSPAGFSIGSSATNLTGLVNAFKVASILANTSTGQSPGSNMAGTATNIESWNVNGIANILAACVNTAGISSSACQSLIANTTGTATAINYTSGTVPNSGGTALAYQTYSQSYTPLDIAQAAWMMARNPATNVTTLFNLAQPSPPFAGATSMSDFTIGYQIASAYGGGSVAPSGAAGYLASPSYVAFDKYGNAFVSNLDINGPTNGTASTPYQPFISEFDAAGNPLTKISSYCTGSSASQGFGANSNSMYNSLTNTFTYSYRIPMYMAFDGSNNLYAYDENAGYVLQIPGSSAAGMATAYTGVSSNCSGYNFAFATPGNVLTTSIATSATIGVKGLAVDSTNNILWLNFKGNGGSAVNGISAGDTGIVSMNIANEFVSSGTPPALTSSAYAGGNSADFGIVTDNSSYPTGSATPGPILYLSNGNECSESGISYFSTANPSDPFGAVFAYFSGSGKFNGTGTAAVSGTRIASMYDVDDTSTSNCGSGLQYPIGGPATTITQYSWSATAPNNLGSTTTNAEPLGNPIALAVDANNSLWGLNDTDTVIAGFAASSSNAMAPYSTTPTLTLVKITPTYTGATPSTANPGISSFATTMATATSMTTYTGHNGQANSALSAGVAIDGAGAAFVGSNNGANANFINEFNNNVVLVSNNSNNSGFVGGSTASNARIFTNAYFMTNAVDRSGNVWVPNSFTTGADIQVLVGVGTAVNTPILSGKSGTLP